MRPVYETSFVQATGCIDCDIPGYLILRPKSDARLMSDLGQEGLSDLAFAMARLEAVIIKITGAERVYICRYSEGLAAVHFHMFPRTSALAEEWRAVTGQEGSGGLIGEALFGWARLHKRVAVGNSLSDEVLSTLESIRTCVERGVL